MERLPDSSQLFQVNQQTFQLPQWENKHQRDWENDNLQQ